MQEILAWFGLLFLSDSLPGGTCSAGSCKEEEGINPPNQNELS